MKAPSHFTVCLTMVILMIVGAALIPLLDVGISPPPRQGSTLTVDFHWPRVAPQVVEHSVTSLIEGIASGVKGVESVSSESFFGYGRVRIRLKKSAAVSAVRFEIASLLRQIYPRLPEGVSYPSLTGGEVVHDDSRTNQSTVLLTYHINSGLPEHEIAEYAESAIAAPLRRAEGVTAVDVAGATGRYLEIGYNPHQLSAYGISSTDIAEAIRNFTGRADIIGDVRRDNPGGTPLRQTLYLASEPVPLAEIPLTTADGHTVYLNNLVTSRIKYWPPGHYYRLNGLNTVYLNISVPAGANLMSLSSRLQKEVAALAPGLREGVYLTLAHDSAAEERTEVFNLVTRSLLSVVILLLCVWLTRRNGRYLFIIASTLAADVLISVIVYYLIGLRLHIFSMAGITVSLSLIIDASIVMADHYSYHRNRKAFLAILAAMLTTIGALGTVFALPDGWQNDLYDFARIIIVNLSVSLLVAVLFVPALTERLRYDSRGTLPLRRARRIVRWDRFYRRYIALLHRHRPLGYALLVLAFGLPLFALPPRLGGKASRGTGEPQPWHERLYNSTLGSDFFRRYVTEPLEAPLGGSLRLFVESLDENRRDEGDQRPLLHIRGQIPQGGTAEELNAKVVLVEDLLRSLRGIERFTTEIDGRGARLDVEFSDSAAFTSLPYLVENRVIARLIRIGGADWSTYGVSQMGFSNSLNLQHRSHRLMLTGYNFDRLCRYASDLCRYVAGNPRVRDVAIEVPGHRSGEKELYLDYDRTAMALYGVKPADLHAALQGLLQTTSVGRYDDGTGPIEVVMKSDQTDRFDKWRILNSYLPLAGSEVKASDLATIGEREATGCIPKERQEYVLAVAFNVLGSYTYTLRFIDETIEGFNALLPMGYRCDREQYGSPDSAEAPYWVLAVVVAVVFFVCAVLFESLRVPLVIISLIPLSFIGLFLTFRLTGTEFGTGGFASMVMLSGVVVNSGIYIFNEYRLLCRRSPARRQTAVRLYVKAYEHKIIPVLLTVASTVLGLVPFFFDGEEEPFWFSFATGVGGGLLFSIPALVFLMPLLLKSASRRPAHDGERPS